MCVSCKRESFCTLFSPFKRTFWFVFSDPQVKLVACFSYWFTTLCYVRVIGEISHPECKITLFHWNNRYLVKLEQGLLEQTYKVPEYDVANEEEVKRLISPDFISKALQQFQTMHETLQDALQKI